MAAISPGALAQTAPPGTRALARFDLATLLQSPSASAALMSLPALAELDECAVVPERDVRTVEIAAGEPHELRVDLFGPITATQIACLLDADPPGDGGNTFVTATLRIAPISGGVRVATPGSLANGSGAPTALASRFEAAARRCPHLLIVDSGKDEPRASLFVSWHETSMALRATLASASMASAAAASFGRALAGARKEGAQGIEGVKATAHGRDLELQVERADAGTALALRSTVLESFLLPSGSMAPGLLYGDHLLVLKGEEGKRVSPGDVVVFDEPQSGKPFMKRVIAVGGERVQIRDEEVRIGGKPVAHVDAGRWDDAEAPGRLVRETRGSHAYRVLFTDGGGAPEPTDLVVPPGHVYLLGDNRYNSHDSRQFGPVPLTAVKGRVVAVAMSLDAAGAMRWDRIGLPAD